MTIVHSLNNGNATPERSTIDPQIPPLTPSHPKPQTTQEPPRTQSLISLLNLQPHVEGGYFTETYRDSTRVPNPFHPAFAGDDTRSASTSIFYLLTPASPLGAFHRNKGKTVHTLHRGRGRYVIIHADEDEVGKSPEGRVRVETFVVGQNVDRGERLQWVVEGGKYKASFIEGEGEEEEELLISETVVPGFEYTDHDFMRMETLKMLVSPEQAGELAWMVRREVSLEQ